MGIPSMFQQQSQPQFQSPLLSLPPEIWSRILYKLLVLDEPIKPHMSRCPGVQVLAVCQKLYQEGVKLFYNKNTFSLRLDLAFVYIDQYRIKDHPIHYRKVKVPFQDSRSTSTAQDFAESAFYGTTISRFPRIQLDINVKTVDIKSDHMRWAIIERLETNLRTLRPVFFGKNVVVVYPHELVSMVNARSIIARSFLMIFELIRCRALYFVGTDQSIADEVVVLSTGNAQIEDLPEQALRLWKRYKRCALLVEEFPFQYRDNVLGERLGNAARRYFPHEFRLAKMEVIKRTEEMIAVAWQSGLISKEEVANLHFSYDSDD